jgi:hypothetical protein
MGISSDRILEAENRFIFAYQTLFGNSTGCCKGSQEKELKTIKLDLTKENEA